MHKNRKLYFFSCIIIILCISSFIIYNRESKTLCLIYSDSLEKDSEIVYLDKNYNIKKNVQIGAMDITTSCYKKGTMIFPTASDNTLFEVNKNGDVKSSKTDLGGNYIKSKGNEQLTLYNVSLEYNRIKFINSNYEEKFLDIKDSLLLCGDFDEKNLYILGYKFDQNKEGDTFLFVIDKNEFKIKDQIKLMKNMRIYDASLVDNNLFIGVDNKVDFLLYYDIKKGSLNKIEYKNYVKDGAIDTKKILYNDTYIFYLSLDGKILQLDRKNLNIIKEVKLNNKVILSGCLDKNKLYTLSVDINKNNQIGSVDVFDCNNMNNIKNFSLNPIRNTTPRDILILD